MSKLLSFVKLDFITLKPYLTTKNLIILLIVATVFSVNKTDEATILGLIMAFALMYSSYPFAVGEKNGIDALYAMLPVSKNNIVLGRYVFFIILDIMSGITACLLLFGIKTIMNHSFNLAVTLLSALVIFIIFSIFQAIQFPIYFKLGYAKAKFLAYTPFIIFPLIAIIIGSRFSDADIGIFVGNFVSWISHNQFFTAVISIIIWFIIMFISYSISLSFYKKREF